MWDSMASCIRKVAKEVLGEFKGFAPHQKESWWWNEEVQTKVKAKKECCKALYKDRTDENGERIRKEEMVVALKKMKHRKAVGPDDIPIEVWKVLGETGITWLTDLFNRILKTKKMPNEWRTSTLVPIYKNKGDVQNCMNYRDDIVLIDETREGVNAKLNLWREVLESKGLRLSRSKTEYMECKFSANGGQNELGVRIGDQEIPKSDRFRYLGSILQKNGELDGDLNHRIQAGWMKWKSACNVLCDRRKPLKLKGKFYRTAIRPVILYGTECWAVKHQHVHKMGVAEMRMLRWMCGHTRKDKIRNEDIRGKVGVAEIEGKMRENRLRWFGHVQRRPTDAPIRRCDYGTEVQGRRGRGRPRKTLEETLRKDLEYLDLTEDMTQDRTQWRSKIHIADPTQ
ncbi:hypothetical protein ACFX12_024872 [Malus domestica]